MNYVYAILIDNYHLGNLSPNEKGIFINEKLR